ncbi:MAG: AAA family ATPase [Coriobacteriia bacterium]
MTTPNPFRPNKPVVPGMFAGRHLEIQGILSTLDQTRVGNAAHVLVVGERGIGKSSLVLAAQAYASMGADGGEGCNFLIVPVTVTGSDTEAVIARRIALKVQQRLGPVKRLTNVQNLIKETWSFLQRVEVAGTKISPGEQISEALDVADKLVAALHATLAIIDGAFDGILITIDEADTAGHELGSLMKRTVDGLGASDNDRVCFILAGLPELPELMKAGHASSLRAFKAFTLGPLKSDERKEVVEKGLAVARADYRTDVQIEAEALNLVSGLSDGYPHFIQQFAYSAYEVDDDLNITVSDVATGAMKSDGAVVELGKSIFHSQYFREVRSEGSRAVLKVLSDSQIGKGGSWVTKAEIRAAAGLTDTQLANALKSLSDKHIILKDASRRGYYRLPTLGFALWIRQTLTAGA